MSVVTLTGFMGTGKTTIGRMLAERLGKPFIDTDECIEKRDGQSIASIFEQRGEAYFRALEVEEVGRAVALDAVVATGGGAIVDVENYRRMQAAGPIVWLKADVDVILKRTAGTVDRPLLNTADRRAQISRLLAERAQAYARADCCIDTSRRSPESIVEEISHFLARFRREQVNA